MNEFVTIESDPKRYTDYQGLADDPVTDVLLDVDEKDVRDRTRVVAAETIAPGAAEADAAHAFPHESVKALSTAGLGGILFPEHLGGTNQSNVAYAIAMEEITAACPSTSLIFMTQMHAAYPIFQTGTEDQQRRYIPGLITAEAYGSIAITEPDAGSDVAGMTTVAKPVDGGWLLNGQKTFITTGDRADVISCFATVDRSAGREGITAFIVEGTAEGVTRGKPFDKLGMHGSSTAELYFDNAFVPTENLIGEEGKGWSIVMNSVGKTRISAAAQGVGLARGTYLRTLAALRHLHGPKLPDEVLFALGEMRGRILQGRLLLVATARSADAEHSITAGQIGVMKQSCTDLGYRTAIECMRLLGPHGDNRRYGVERLARDAKVTQIYDGTNEIQRLLIGRETSRALKGMNA
jgi:alkylation response protein AidB-like acyl-CoA dehydrogenase